MANNKRLLFLNYIYTIRKRYEWEVDEIDKIVVITIYNATRLIGCGSPPSAPLQKVLFVVDNVAPSFATYVENPETPRSD